MKNELRDVLIAQLEKVNMENAELKLRLSDVIVQVCSTCKGHKLLLNEIGFPITCVSCNGSGKQT